VTRVDVVAHGQFGARVVCRANPEVSASAATVLDEAVVATTATGTVVVPA
jgi:3-aminobutyryl-CoA ammonia-lyase